MRVRSLLAGRLLLVSAGAHLRGEDPQGRLALPEWRRCYTPARWAEALEAGLGEEATRERIRATTTNPRLAPAAVLQLALSWELPGPVRGEPRSSLPP